MSMLHVGFGASGGYTVAKSLRLRSSATAYLYRGFTTATNNRVWTLSAFIKRGALGTFQRLLAAYDGTSVASAYVLLNDDNTMSVNTKGTQQLTNTTAVFRDPAAFYHVLVAVNLPAGVQQIYVNNALVGTVAVTDAASQINGSYTHYLGCSHTATQLFDGLLSEVYFVDGQALTPSSFGNSDPVTGVWVPKAYTGTYGNNGFYLPFNDGSNLTNLCLDRSGNGNNWTAMNVSLTAGATYDWMDDTPTNNYATQNILDVDRGDLTTSNANLTVTKAAANSSPRAAATVGVRTGKWYCEATWASMTDANPSASYYLTGVTTKESWTTTSNGFNTVMYAASNTAGAANGQKAVWTGGSYSGFTAYGSGYFVNGSVVGIALDMDAGTVTFYFNGASQGAITLPTTAEAWFPYCTSDGTNNAFTVHWNFGQRPFAYTPPTGFRAICTGNTGPIATVSSGSFSGNASADGPFVWLAGSPSAMTINGNAVTWGTHADKLANGVKLRTSSASYNAAGSNSFTVSTYTDKLTDPNRAKANP